MNNSIVDGLKSFAGAVSADADELIGRTVLKATGQHFDDYVRSGGVPPLSLFFKAYAASTTIHLKQALHPQPKLQITNLQGELINPAGEVIGSTEYSRELERS